MRAKIITPAPAGGGDMEDWTEAKEHLETVEEAYTSIGSAGYFALNLVIRPCRDRFNSGERTKELYDEIMGIAL